jgi:hypothetical protein
MTAAEIRKLLLAWRNRDGGWGYYPSKRSRLEATCWSVLALRDAGLVAPFAEWPKQDGLLLEQVGGTLNYTFNGLALVTMVAIGQASSEPARNVLAALRVAKGKAIEPSTVNRQDNSLQGWSWVADTFSWVEPTACCLFALKSYARRTGEPVDASRVEVAERLLRDRMCVDGGWNYGNSNMLGSELHAYVPTTALVLLALQDRASAAWVQLSLEWLARHALTEQSTLALALATLALDVHGRPTGDVRRALIDMVSITLSFQQIAVLAAAACALDDKHDATPFVL